VQFSDESLVKETRAGSQVAFEQLIKRYEKLVFRVAYSYTRRAESALDISQEIFIKAYRRLDSYRSEGSFKAWLLGIARNESADWLRRDQRFRNHNELTPENTPSCPPVQEAEILERENRQTLLDQMLHLNPRQRLAVSLRYFEKRPIREIAAALDCSEGTAKSILFRSLAKLRNRMTTQRSRSHEGMSAFSGDDRELPRG